MWTHLCETLASLHVQTLMYIHKALHVYMDTEILKDSD